MHFVQQITSVKQQGLENQHYRTKTTAGYGKMKEGKEKCQDHQVLI